MKNFRDGRTMTDRDRSQKLPGAFGSYELKTIKRLLLLFFSFSQYATFLSVNCLCWGAGRNSKVLNIVLHA